MKASDRLVLKGNPVSIIILFPTLCVVAELHSTMVMMVSDIKKTQDQDSSEAVDGPGVKEGLTG